MVLNGGVVQQVGLQQAVFAGEGVHQHLGHGGTVGEVVEGLALQGRGIPVQARCRIKAVGPQLNTLGIGQGHQFGKGHGQGFANHCTAREHHLFGNACRTFGQ